MIDVETQRINKADVYLTLGGRPIPSGDNIPPLGGKPVTPEEEMRTGDQLRYELEKYRADVKDGSLRKKV